jgi:hypothetical protein
MRAAVVFLVSFGWLGCTTTTASSPNSGAPGAQPASTPEEQGDAYTAKAEGIALRTRRSFSEITRMPGSKEQITIVVEVRNDSATTAVTADITRFTLGTSTGLEVSPHPETALHANACKFGNAAAQGGTISCVIVFETAPATASELRYLLPSGAWLPVQIPSAQCNTLDQHADKTPLEKASAKPVFANATKAVQSGTFASQRRIVLGFGSQPDPNATERTTIRFQANRFDLVRNRVELVSGANVTATYRMSGTYAEDGSALVFHHECAWFKRAGSVGRADVPDAELGLTTSFADYASSDAEGRLVLSGGKNNLLSKHTEYAESPSDFTEYAKID